MSNDFNKTIDMVTSLLEGSSGTLVDGYEIFLSSSEGTAVEVKAGEVEAFKVRSETGVGIRIIKDDRPGFGYTNVFVKEDIERMVRSAIDGSAGASVDSALCFAGKTEANVKASELDLIDDGFEALSESAKIECAADVESSAKGFDERIATVRKASYNTSRTTTKVVNSKGVSAKYEATFYSASVMAVATSKPASKGDAEDSQVGWEISLGHKRADVDCAGVGSEAARRAVEMLGAKQLGTIKCSAVFENTVVMDFLGVLASALSADNVMKGKSMLAEKTGKKVLSKLLNIYDDGLIKGGWSSSPFDAEGVARRRTPLIVEGVCEGYLYDSYWAARAGVSSTGNAARGGFKGAPGIGTSNFYIEKGAEDLKALIGDVGDGLFITDVMGVHTIDAVSGDFSLGASGMRVEGGRLTGPVRGMAISGNILELFSRVEAVGSDLRFVGSVGAPSLLVGGIEASGA